MNFPLGSGVTSEPLDELEELSSFEELELSSFDVFELEELALLEESELELDEEPELDELELELDEESLEEALSVADEECEELPLDPALHATTEKSITEHIIRAIICFKSFFIFSPLPIPFKMRKGVGRKIPPAVFRKRILTF